MALSGSLWLSQALFGFLRLPLAHSSSLWLTLARSPTLWEVDYKREAGLTSHLYHAPALFCRKTLKYGTFCRKMLEYSTFAAKRKNTRYEPKKMA